MLIGFLDIPLDSFAECEYNVGMIKGQDIVVLMAHLDASCRQATYASLGRLLHLSASETFEAVRRLRQASLLDFRRIPVPSHVMEFLSHGIQYVFPPEIRKGKMAVGMPTGFAAPVARDSFAITGPVPIWEDLEGTAFGPVVSPVYPTVPQAARGSRHLYDCLSLVEMLRWGRIRERVFALRKFEEFA